jgi:pyruvyl transferase EpsO
MVPVPKDSDIMLELKRKLSMITDVLPEGSVLHYFDYPVHGNVGDLLIMQGTERFFRDYGMNVQGRYSVYDYQRLLRKGHPIPQNHVLVCHGGGNFGDIYERHQKLRDELVEYYTDHRIILMPQTIFFHDVEAEKRTFERYSQHKDVHLFVRDKRSFEIASKYLEQVYLCPDMAHQLYPIRSEIKPSKKTLHFLRTDVEASHPNSMLTDKKGADVLDWPSLISPMEHRLIRLFAKLHHSGKLDALGLHGAIQRAWYSFVDRLVAKSVRRYSEYEEIVTSRLHGHILSCLMSKENRLLDNMYGKNTGYSDMWTARLSIAKRPLS